MSSESGQEEIECAVCECFESAEERTPCCYERVCDEHSETFPMCSRKSCVNHHNKMCEICLEINSWKCSYCGLILCQDCNITKYLCRC